MDPGSLNGELEREGPVVVLAGEVEILRHLDRVVLLLGLLELVEIDRGEPPGGPRRDRAPG
jgi:hypothetical protein